MKKLLKQYGLNSDMQYFEIIVESFLSGQIKQSQEQFNAMSKDYKKAFVKSSLTNWGSGLSQTNILKYFFELI
jgi:hypothetical protein